MLFLEGDNGCVCICRSSTTSFLDELEKKNWERRGVVIFHGVWKCWSSSTTFGIPGLLCYTYQTLVCGACKMTILPFIFEKKTCLFWIELWWFLLMLAVRLVRGTVYLNYFIQTLIHFVVFEHFIFDIDQECSFNR